jgi:ectoine hydroxylase-related dioxygenase (phytanoyl-CoA dioxygenase family)
MTALARTHHSRSTWLRREDCSIAEFAASVDTGRTTLEDYPYAEAVEREVLIYGPSLTDVVRDPEHRREVQAELVSALLDGPGIIVFRAAFDTDVIDRATAAFMQLLAAQKATGSAAGDHFAPPGANDRIWGALDKLAIAHPAVFADYYANDLVALASAAWLGPNYQMTSALNIVNPGGQAQVPHRDYHLGFMPLTTAADYPAHVHRLSPVLTLQGAVAHCDMPVGTGPTMYLPHSQKYLPGYLAAGLDEFVDHFAQHYVQLPLAKGDAVFFNPALFHGAGTNHSADVYRMANLLQVSSAFGRPLEAVDRTAASIAIYPVLRERKRAGAPARDLANVVAAAAEGYPFPTNLDRDQPIGSLNPETQAELVLRALDGDWPPERVVAELGDLAVRHTAG